MSFQNLYNFLWNWCNWCYKWKGGDSTWENKSKMYNRILSYQVFYTGKHFFVHSLDTRAILCNLGKLSIHDSLFLFVFMFTSIDRGTVLSILTGSNRWYHRTIAEKQIIPRRNQLLQTSTQAKITSNEQIFSAIGSLAKYCFYIFSTRFFA